MGAERLWFYLRLYPYCVVRSIQAKMSYKSDFILGVTASILMQSLGFVFVWAIFQGIPEMKNYIKTNCKKRSNMVSQLE